MKRIVLLLISLMSISLMMSAQSTLTEEDDIKNVTEYVKDTYFNYTSFKVEPLYNVKDERAYYLVEFEPTSFLIFELSYYPKTSCYTPLYYYVKQISHWEKYKCMIYVDTETNKKNFKKIYLPEENGEYVKYYDTPYKVAGYENEKKYLIKYNGIQNSLVPAVKIGDKFLNLVSMEEFTISDLKNKGFMPGFDDEFLIGGGERV